MTRWPLFMIAAAMTMSAAADQFRSFDDVEIHYVVVNTLFLQPDVAAHYGIVRSKDRAIVNVSVLGPDGAAVAADVSGTTVNLLSQEAPLEFAVINEEQSIYYIAPIRYTDQDVLRFRINVALADRAPMNFEFQQTMYVEPNP
jgi:Domain of unknown function (DUF4426)